MKNSFEFVEKFSAEYEVRNGMITVSIHGIGEKSAQLGDIPEKNLAEMLAHEIIKGIKEKDI